MNRIDFSDVGFLLQADALERLRALPEHCVYVCVTSPPYYGLRDYGVKGQLGLEGSVPAYLAAMVRVFREAAKKQGAAAHIGGQTSALFAENPESPCIYFLPDTLPLRPADTPRN